MLQSVKCTRSQHISTAECVRWQFGCEAQVEFIQLLLSLPRGDLHSCIYMHYHHPGFSYASSSCLNRTPAGVLSWSCHQSTSGKQGFLAEVGAQRPAHLTLNSGKTRPCFPAESAHYKRQYKSFPQASTTPWPQMGVNGAGERRAKPQMQTSNLANKHRPCECQPGTHMYTFCLSSRSTQVHSEWLQLLWTFMLCCNSCAKGTFLWNKTITRRWMKSYIYMHHCSKHYPKLNDMVT